MKRWWAIGIAVLVALAALGWSLSTPSGAPVEVGQVRRGTIRAYVEERAKTRLPEVYQITMPLQGRILPIELEEGDLVTEGQVVARMDPNDLETDLTEANNTVSQYDRNLEQLDLAIEQATQTVLASQSKYEFAEREFGRVSELFRRQAVSESERQQAELAMIDSRVDLRKDELQKSMYLIGKRVVELMRETEVTKRAKVQRDWERTAIKSPVGGVVLSREESNERVLQAGEVLMEIGDLAALEVEADVLTQDALLIETGAPVDIETPQLGDKVLQGRIAKIFPRGFTKVSSLGVEQQRVKVVIDFDPQVLASLQTDRRQLGVDYRLRVKIYTAQSNDTLIVPRGAFFRDAQGAWQVFAVRAGKAEPVTVETGIRNDYEVEVLGGLEEGEQVVLAPDSALQAGGPVQTGD